MCSDAAFFRQQPPPSRARARYYDPNLGRFISADSIVQDPYDTQVYGRYTYCVNNPIVYSDPTGHLFFFDDLLVSIVATVVNSVQNGVLTPTICYNVWGFGGVSASYNFGNGVTSLSGNVGGLSLGFASLTYGFNASYSFGGGYISGSFGVGIGCSFLGFMNASLGTGINFNNQGLTGIYATAGMGINGNGGYYSGGAGISATYTWGFNGTSFTGQDTMAFGVNFSGSYAGCGATGSVSYTCAAGNIMSGSTSWGLQATYDPTQAGNYVQKQVKNYNNYDNTIINTPPTLSNNDLLKLSSYITIGDKDFIINGGTLNEKMQVQSDLKDIFSTSRGKDMLKELESRKILGIFKKTFTINLNVKNNAYAIVGGDEIHVDPKFHPNIDTTSGSLAASTRRIIAHELGHAVFSERDDGINHMNNVNKNENPIMNSLNEPSRIRY